MEDVQLLLCARLLSVSGVVWTSSPFIASITPCSSHPRPFYRPLPTFITFFLLNISPIFKALGDLEGGGL